MVEITEIEAIEASLIDALVKVKEIRRRLESEQAQVMVEQQQQQQVTPEIPPKPPLVFELELPKPQSVNVGLRIFPDWRDPLKELLMRFRREGLTDAGEVELLRELILNESRLQTFPSDTQVLLLAFAVARLRHHQKQGLPDSTVSPLIGMVGAYARRTQVGFVYGAGRADDPKFGLWEKDAREKMDRLSAQSGLVKSPPSDEKLLERIREAVQSAAPFLEIEHHLLSALDQGVRSEDVRLVKLMAPFLVELGQRARYKVLRRAIRDADEALKVEEIGEASVSIPSDWPWFKLTTGKRVIMVGGEPREESRVRIEKAFQMEELDWEGTESKPMGAQKVRDRVLAGKVGLVILLRFNGHTVDQVILPACRSTHTPFVYIPNGYGIDAIRQQIERLIPGL